MKKPYIKRIADNIIEFALKSKGCVLIVGPKWCGKSRTAEQFAKSAIYMQNLETREQNINLAKTTPHLFLTNTNKPLLIDEWQIIPFIWDQIRFEVDQNNEFGQYILTGSAVPVNNNDYSHTGTGRIVSKLMRPMSLFESKDSDGKISLKDLFNNKFMPTKCSKNLLDYAYFVCRGGWPLAIGEKEDIALIQAHDYYLDLIKESMFKVPGIKINKDTEKTKTFIRAYSRNIGTQCSDNELAKDTNLDIATLNKYLLIAKNLFVIEECPAWNTNLRSKTAIRTKSTRYFVDPSIATSSLGLKPLGLINNLNTFGFLFENLAIRDLRIYAESIGANIYHYRDKFDREIDAIIQYDDGRFGLVEIKLNNPDAIEKSAKKLIRLSRDIIQEHKPSFMAILTTTSASYKREDGIYVISLANLKN